jgi:hypothetical protein
MPTNHSASTRRGVRVLLAAVTGVGLLLGATACNGGGDSNGGADGGNRTSSAPAVSLTR